MWGDRTIHRLALSFTDSFVLGDEEVKFLIWAFDGPYLILFVDEIPDDDLALKQFFVQRHGLDVP